MCHSHMLIFMRARACLSDHVAVRSPAGGEFLAVSSVSALDGKGAVYALNWTRLRVGAYRWPEPASLRMAGAWAQQPPVERRWRDGLRLHAKERSRRQRRLT
ncbi:conserved hypothetical protein [Xanthomonas citri pv. fuscans]|nr:conserved hypothetical protein [Xanthomonas citri pv. fuscans]SOO32613.1 hypothetical protein XFF6994_200014 [Xanthomonas citri pv. fuscans]